MVKIVYSGLSAPSARYISEQSDEIQIAREHVGDINWGRNYAQTALNPDTSNATNKRVMRELFTQHEVPMPRLMTFDEALEHVASGGVVIGRPDRHAKGRGFWKCDTERRVEIAARGSRKMPKKKPATHFMEFISPERAPKEFRAHIFKGRSIRISEKDHVAFHDYTTVRPSVEDRTVLREAAKRAVAALGLDFGAVDILASEDGQEAWVLEVNTAPGLGGSMPRVYAETFLEWKRGER